MAISSLPKLTLNLKSLFHYYPFPPPSFLLRLFSSSSSSSSSPPQNDDSTPNPEPSPFADYFSDIKSKFKQQPTRPIPSKASTFEEIRKNLSEFRRRNNLPVHSTPPPVSFEELYKKNVLQNRPGTTQSPPSTSHSPTGFGFNRPPNGNYSFEFIRESLKQMKNKIPSPSPSPSGVERNDPVVIGGTREGFLPPGGLVFGGEKSGEDNERRMDTEFARAYTVEELGKKLRELRNVDAGKKEGWFSLEELNDRLRKLRELEEKEAAAKGGAMSYTDLRKSLLVIKKGEEDKNRKIPSQRVSILDHLGVAPNYMMHPPKEELVEKYFHPDNMSASEKLKIELAKVRDEFKMSESDCGSARVQVAQLTTKIKYLSSVLHKKDKHSLKGLQAMVQQRKKLLKYLRRTDWDSYCLVLDKLGLRDNADLKTRSQ